MKNLEPKFPIGLQAGQKIQQMLDRLTARLALEADNDVARRRLMQFQSGIAKGVYVSASYNAGRFAREDVVARFDKTIHGFGLGLSLDLRYVGPLCVEAGRTNTGGAKTYLSLGRQF